MRLIDADTLDIDNLNRAYDNNFELDFGRLYTTDVIDMITNAPTINAIPIPEDATNGEVINMVFPNLAIIKETHSIYVFQGRIMIMRVDRDWWNAKYKAESED